MFWKTLVFAFLAVGAYAENEVSEAHKQILFEVLYPACEKAGAEDEVVDLKNSTTAFVDCMKGIINDDQLKQEIEAAQPNGALDEVFKYCAKTPEIKTCIHTLIDGTSPCVEESDKSDLNTAKNMIDQLIDFVCYKDGDRIALFIAEDGPECFNSKTMDIEACIEDNKNSISSVDDAKKLTPAERCGKIDQVSTCIVTALKKCQNPTPGNMAESLFKYVRKGSLCNTELPLNN